MKMRIRALLLAAMMVVSLLPAMSFADAEVTEVGSLDALTTALNEGKTNIKVTAQITVSSDTNLEPAQDVVITSAVEDAFTVTAGTLKLGNKITIHATESILYATGATAVIEIDGAVLNITASTHNAGFANNGGTINVKSGEINGKNGKTTLSISGGKANISGGKVTSDSCTVIVSKNGGQVTISGGTVETTCLNPEFVAVDCQNGSSVTVSGGTVKAAAGQAVVTNYYSTTATVAISGGTLIGGEKGAVYNSASNTAGSFTITGGTFSHEIPEEMNITASGYTIIPPPVYAGPVMNWVKVNAAENGVVKSGPLAASAGATVTLYPKAAEGYVLDTVEVLDAEGNTVELDGLKFAIPAGGVTVNATFKLAQ